MHPEYVVMALLIVLAVVFLLAFLPVELLPEEEDQAAEECSGREATVASFTANHANSGAETTSMI
jgi:hypothetical protein